MVHLTDSSSAVPDAVSSRLGSNRFRLGPFRLHSDISLVELREGGGEEALPVTVCLGAVQGRTAGMLELSVYSSVAKDRFLLYIPGVARYLVENGNRVTVELEDGAPEADVRGYLLGSVFGALCHQNGFLPLHASAVAADGQVTAFLGDSGAGKSTMAAFLERAGYRVVSDDICLLVPEADGLRVAPVAGWLKLWQESFDSLGEVPAEENRIFSATEKYRRYLEPAGEERLKLGNVVLLAQGEEDCA